MKKKILIITLVLCCLSVSGCVSKKKKALIKKFDKQVTCLEKNNGLMEKEINKLRKQIKSKDEPLDVSLIEKSSNLIKQYKKDIKDKPSRPFKEEAISKEVNKLEKYNKNKDKQLMNIKKVNKQFSDSIKQRKQLTNPSEKFVKERLKNINEVMEIEAVNEDNDPNGKLNKQGGYTSTVYFTLKQVNQKEFEEMGCKSVIDKGTDGGGAIEVYRNEQDAKSRNDYLASFDASLNSGYHQVLGTVVVRVSNKLSASKQKQVYNDIYKEFIKLK